MKLKKSFAFLLALALVFSLAACGGAEQPVAKENSAYVLDYDTIAAWVDGGYLGMSDAGEAVLMVLNADMTMAGILFGNPESGEAASFFGEMKDNGDGTITINDAINGLSITFGVERTGDIAVALDMGAELGAAQLEAVPLDTLLESLQDAINNFNHVA